MSILKKFLITSRYDKPHGILLLFFPCVWGLSLNQVNIKEKIFLYIIFFIGSCGMRSLGCIWNDFNDKALDIQVSRTKTRLIASNNVKNKEMILFALINGIIGSFPLYFLSTYSVLISLTVVPLIIVYPFMKRLTWWPQLWLGLCFNWGILVGFSVFNNSLFNLELVLFYIGSVFFTVGYDTIYGFQDLVDDEKIGIKSTSIKFKKTPKLFLFLIYSFAFIFWILSLYQIERSFLIIFLFLYFYFFILIKVKLLNFKNPLACNKLFNYNSYICLAITLVLMIK